MPRSAAALAALILAAGPAVAETKPNAAPSSATLPPPAALKQAPVMQPGVAIISLERQFNFTGCDIVAKLSNASAEAAPKGSHGLELKCTSPMAAARTVRRVLHAVGGHGQLEIAIFENRQVAPVAPNPTPVGFPNLPTHFGSGDNGESPSQEAPLTAGLPWSCSVSVSTNPARPGSGVPKTIAWGVEFDYGISDISFEKAMTAPPTVNVRVAVLSKKIGNASFALPVAGDLRKVRLACSKPGEASKNAESPAADSVLFGTPNAGFLPAPASGWSCRATLVGPGADLDPTNDTWALTAP